MRETLFWLLCGLADKLTAAAFSPALNRLRRPLVWLANTMDRLGLYVRFAGDKKELP